MFFQMSLVSQRQQYGSQAGTTCAVTCCFIFWYCTDQLSGSSDRAVTPLIRWGQNGERAGKDMTYCWSHKEFVALWRTAAVHVERKLESRRVLLRALRSLIYLPDRSQ